MAAAGGVLSGAEVDYKRDVQPILRERCYACHGALKSEAGLRLDAASLIRKGGGSGAVIVPGNAASSLLIDRISSSDASYRMPPEGRALEPKEVARLRAWVVAGAPAPADDRPEEDPNKHWAFLRPMRPPVPDVNTPEWRDHPIDAFIAREHEERRLRPVSLVSKPLLLRRLYVDLIGLPPSRQEIHAFLNDDSAEAVERVVAELLANPQYGERWGRHWMDVWRYTDWYGLGAQLRNSQKHIWHWRDWIVDSLNADKGYDRMVLEMLAGDEIAPADLDAVTGTGFLARNYYLFNRTTWLDDTIEHTSKAFLGLTMNCAKCHDHKYDPVTQLDYYRMRAIFEPHQVRLDPLPGEIDLEKDGLPRVFDAHPQAPTYLHVRGDAKEQDKSRAIEPGTPEFLTPNPLDIAPISLSLDVHRPELRQHVIANHLDAATRAVANARDELKRAEVSIAAAPSKKANASQGKSERATPRSTNSTEATDVDSLELDVRVAKATLAAAELHFEALRTAHAADMVRHSQATPTNAKQLIAVAAQASRAYDLAKSEADVVHAERRLARATQKEKAGASKKLETARKNLQKSRQAMTDADDSRYTSLRASRKALEGPDESEESRYQPYPETSTGRRSALAHWIVDAENPLTARVAVNHIWMRHFGEPLVESVTDFGRRAQRPPLQPLLDWLAVEFIGSGWSMKHLHHLIVTSRTYALSSSTLKADPTTHDRDPTNTYYWRRRPLRMESQVVRDSLLLLAGVLETELGGPTIDPGRPESEKKRRRSLYFTQSRDHQHEFLNMFDDADILRCYRRSESIVPQQALALVNSRLAMTMARETAKRIEGELGDLDVEAAERDDRFIEHAYELILAVTPTTEERRACQETLETMRTRLTERQHPHPVKRARENLVHALINHNDFITLR